MKMYGGPDQNQRGNVWSGGINNNGNMMGPGDKNYLEKNGPNRKNLKVLHEDGSFADFPDRDIPGAGALAGCITK